MISIYQLLFEAVFLFLSHAQVYSALNEHKEMSSEVPPAPDTDKNAVVEFHAATVAVKEKIGKFAVTIWRHGNLDPQVRVR